VVWLMSVEGRYSRSVGWAGVVVERLLLRWHLCVPPASPRVYACGSVKVMRAVSSGLGRHILHNHRHVSSASHYTDQLPLPGVTADACGESTVSSAPSVEHQHLRAVIDLLWGLCVVPLRVCRVPQVRVRSPCVCGSMCRHVLRSANMHTETDTSDH